MGSMAVEMRDIVKSFNGVRVLDDVDFELRKGEIHALMGENGAGKSTLMKILQGVYSPDAGQILVDGQPVQIASTQDAHDQGIVMIFQEFSLIPTLSVAQNVHLTREARTQTGLLDDREIEQRTRALFKEMEVGIDPRARVAKLSAGYQQLTEIAKALSQDARILIMDEPTASLTKNETDSLFAIMQRLKGRGISIIYISHRMEEIFQIADRVTVLRDGEHIITDDIANLTMQQVVDHIVGRKVQTAFQWAERVVDRQGTPLLEVRDLSSGTNVQDVSFSLYPGEILGLAGLMGSGRTELAQAIFGINRIDRGEVRVRGQKVRIQSPEDAIAAGIALIPEDRRIQGLVLGHSIRDNVLLPLLERLLSGRLINDRKGNKLSQTLLEKLNTRMDSMFMPVRLLSGGNQQKVVIAKWLGANPDILIMDEPTAGVDIGTKTEIVEMIRQLADAGKGIIVISSELPELLAVSDRILVVREGQIEREMDRREIEAEEDLHHVLQGVES